jgi:hypothetical protein
MTRVDPLAAPRDAAKSGSADRTALSQRSLLTTLIALAGRDSSARVVHYASLVIGAAVLLYVGRHQDFFFDDWAFLVPGAADIVNVPHVGHWSATPTLVFIFLRDIFGLNSYVPFLALAILAHLAVTHLLWRVMVRVGVHRWIAVAMAVLMLFLGAGGENIFWAFQFGFVGAIAVGLWAVVVIDQQRLTPIRGVAVAVLILWALTFSGTAIPLVGAAILVSLARHGVLKSVYVFAVPLLAYAAWYLGPGSVYDGSASRPGGGKADIVLATLDYAGHMFVDGFQKLSPLPATGIVLVIALFVWCAKGGPAFTSRAAPAYALAAGAVAFSLLTGFSRSGLGTEYAASGRYVYLVVALTIPAFALFATQLAQRRWLRVGGALTIIAVAIVYNAATLYHEAARQAALEAESSGRLAAALALIEDSGDEIDGDVHPVPLWAPDVSVSDIRAFADAGWLTVQPYDDQDQLDVDGRLLVEIEAAPADVTCAAEPTAEPTGVLTAAPGTDDTSFYLPVAGDVTLNLRSGVLEGLAETRRVEAGWWTVDNASGFDAQISAPEDTIEFCTAP